MNSQNQIQLAPLTELIINLVGQSCEIMHQYADSTKIEEKGQQDYVTEIDFLVQHIIEGTIRKQYPSINIVGEENFESAIYTSLKDSIHQKIPFSKKISEIHLPQNANFSNQSFDPKELTVWIDPLDCTYGFVSNRKYEITILVGIAYKGRPICGVIGCPYQLVDGVNAFEPAIYCGSTMMVNKGVHEYRLNQHQWLVVEKKDQQRDNTSKKVAIGWRQSTRQSYLIEKLKLAENRAGGAGNKIIKIIRNEVSTMMFVDISTCKWDSCAGEALILSLGGYVIKGNLKEIDYNDKEVRVNTEGFMMTTQKEIYESFKYWVRESYK